MDSLRSFYESLTTFEISEYNYTEVTSSYKYKYAFSLIFFQLAQFRFSLPIERFEGTREVTRFLQNYWQHTITVSVS